MQKIIITALISILALSGIALMYTDNSVSLKLSNDNFLSNNSKDVYKQYTAWKQQHGKNTNGSEDELRFKIFQENLDFINKNNQQNSDLTLALTKFADLTNEEFRNLMTIKRNKNFETSDFDLTEQQVSNSPDYQDVNWVAKGAVTAVKNQGSCGSCWAFSTVGSLEGLHYITTGTLETLSEQQVTSCTPSPFSDGCRGGFSMAGLAYTTAKGIESESAYPYVNGNTGKTAKCEYDSSKVVFQNKGQGHVKENSPQLMNQQLQQQPLAVAVDAGSIYFQLYGSGIIQSKNCGTQLNHEVTLVGYTSSDNTWTFKNSWGTGWGLKGFAKILNVEGEGTCGINMDPNYPTM